MDKLYNTTAKNPELAKNFHHQIKIQNNDDMDIQSFLELLFRVHQQWLDANTFIQSMNGKSTNDTNKDDKKRNFAGKKRGFNETTIDKKTDDTKHVTACNGCGRKHPNH